MLSRLFAKTEPPPKPGRLTPGIWMAYRTDLREMSVIERASYANPWSEAAFGRLLFGAGQLCFGMVAEVNHRIAGYVLFGRKFARVEIVKLAVAPESRRRGVGTALLHRVASVTGGGRRVPVQADISEFNLGAQLFLRSAGFVAIEVLRGVGTRGEDLYRFVLGAEDESCRGR